MSQCHGLIVTRTEDGHHWAARPDGTNVLRLVPTLNETWAAYQTDASGHVLEAPAKPLRTGRRTVQAAVRAAIRAGMVAAALAAVLAPARAAGPWDAGPTVRHPEDGAPVTVQVEYIGTVLRCAAPDTLRILEDGSAACESSR